MKELSTDLIYLQYIHFGGGLQGESETLFKEDPKVKLFSSILRLTNMEVENPLFVKESSLPKDRFPLPC